MILFCTIILELIAIFTTVNGSNILFFSLFSTKSHKIIFDPMAEELGKRGHNVVLFTSSNSTRTVANVTEVYAEEIEKLMSDANFLIPDNTVSAISANLKKFLDIVDVTYLQPLVQEIIKNPRDPNTGAPKYDLFIIDAVLNDFALPLAHHMNVPVIYISPTILLSIYFWYMDIPFSPSSVPTGVINIPNKMSFRERALNAFDTLVSFYKLSFLFSQIDVQINQYIPNTPRLNELLKNVSMVMSSDHPCLGRSLPTMPYYVQLGGIHCNPANKLQDDLENFMQSAGPNGVIYFSLGSVLETSWMPDEMIQKLVKAFAQLPQKILWKTAEVVEGVSNNVSFIKWAPQQDILAHSNLKLFITHGGSLSTQEAAYHGCPILGFPVCFDQFGNVANAVSLGFAEYLDWKTFTVDELLDKIKLMLEDNSYRLNARKMSRIFKDRPEHPVQTAAYWVEYIIRHNGAPHLKSGAEHLNFFQYILLDVIIAIVAVILFGLAILVLMIRCLLKLICSCQQFEEKEKKNIKLKNQ